MEAQTQLKEVRATLDEQKHKMEKTEKELQETKVRNSPQVDIQVPLTSRVILACKSSIFYKEAIISPKCAPLEN